ncbi:MAG: hypothetical protein CM15mP51_13010 [Porticoccaceae bacterium]|nr:MAG: hypothetical protein CM15mP51_13010 [Porticoccaceae bacterium]
MVYGGLIGERGLYQQKINNSLCDRVSISSHEMETACNKIKPRPWTFYFLKNGLSFSGSTKPGLMENLADVEAITYRQGWKKIRGFITIPNFKTSYPWW